MSSKKPLGTPFIELLTVDSTNNYATTLAHEGMAQHGTAVFAHDQTRGRGQRSRHWVSTKGKNIALSIIIEPQNLSTSQMFFLSMAVALGCYRFFNRYAEKDTSIKWPNDIYWRDRKAGGILIENILQGSSWKYAIAGVGININQTEFGELNTKAVSLKQITGKESEPVSLAKELCHELDLALNQLWDDPSIIFDEYNRHLYLLNEMVRLKKGNRIFDATIKGVNEQGQLVVQHALEEKFDVGEVEWVGT